MILLVAVSFFLCQALGNFIAVENSVRRSGISKRMVGGEFTKIQIHPWLASIQKKNSHICGGSIISKNVVLTAAHCATDHPSNLSVRVGSSSVDRGGSQHKVVQIMIHQFFSSQPELLNDLALVKVSPPFEFGRNVSNIHLVKSGAVISPGTIASIAGWGRMTIEGQRTKELRRASLRIIDNGLCSRYYGDYSGKEISLNLQICAAAPGTDVCKGDSGSPLIVDHVQVGILSCGNGCTNLRPILMHPGIYTNIAIYRDWIDNNTKILDSQ